MISFPFSCLSWLVLISQKRARMVSHPPPDINVTVQLFFQDKMQMTLSSILADHLAFQFFTLQNCFFKLSMVIVMFCCFFALISCVSTFFNQCVLLLWLNDQFHTPLNNLTFFWISGLMTLLLFKDYRTSRRQFRPPQIFYIFYYSWGKYIISAYNPGQNI